MPFLKRLLLTCLAVTSLRECCRQLSVFLDLFAVGHKYTSLASELEEVVLKNLICIDVVSKAQPYRALV